MASRVVFFSFFFFLSPFLSHVNCNYYYTFGSRICLLSKEAAWPAHRQGWHFLEHCNRYSVFVPLDNNKHLIITTIFHQYVIQRGYHVHTSKTNSFCLLQFAKGEKRGFPMFCHIFLFGVGSNQRGEVAMGGQEIGTVGFFWGGPAYNGLGWPWLFFVSPRESIGNCHGIFWSFFWERELNRSCFLLRRWPLSRVASGLIFHIYYYFFLPNFFLFERDIYRLRLD